MPEFTELNAKQAGIVSKIQPLSATNVVGIWDFGAKGKVKVHLQKLYRSTIQKNPFDYFRKAFLHTNKDEILCCYILGWEGCTTTNVTNIRLNFYSILDYLQNSQEYEVILWRDQNEFYDSKTLLNLLSQTEVLVPTSKFWRVHSGNHLQPVAIYNVLTT